MSETMRVAAVQMDVEFANVERNLDRITHHIREAFAELIVFPECAVTGYCFDSLDEALPYAEEIPGPATERLVAACSETGKFAVTGLLERHEGGLHNVCVLTGPAGVIGLYRKVHLPHLGVDRFATPGDRPFDVHAAGPARVGLMICYDSAFPEAARCLALRGAEILALPTNFPPGAEGMADFVIRTRAMENHVYFLCVNRVGVEAGFTFIGKSRICGPDGTILAEAGPDEEVVLQAEIDLSWARNKHIVRVPDKHHIDRFKDRRPEMYQRLQQK